MMLIIAFAFLSRYGQIRRLLQPAMFGLLITVLMCTHLAAQQRPRPIVTSDDVFYVPFTVPASSVESQPNIVELFVSGDHGKTWTPYQQRNPNEGKFSFRAGVDGEFWFAVRTIDANGQPSVKRVQNPELIVIVDREKPQLNIVAKVDMGGQVRAEWSAADRSLSASDLKLEYRIKNEDVWRSVDVQPHSLLTEDGTIQGQSTWFTPAGTSEIEIRATAKDRAGNVSMVERDVQVLAAGPPPQNAGLAGDRQPPPFSGIPLPASLDPLSVPGVDPAHQPRLMKTQGPVAQSQQTQQSQQSPNTHARTPLQGEVQNPYVDNASGVTVEEHGIMDVKPPAVHLPASSSTFEDSPPASSETPVPSTASNNDDKPQRTETNEGWQNNPFVTTEAGSDTVTNVVSPPKALSLSPSAEHLFAERPGSNLSAANDDFVTHNPDDIASQSPLESGPNGMLVSKSRRFNLDYGVETSGSDGVYRIEVWFTDDGGRTWRHHGDDEDRVSPYLVDVTLDGLYGFRLIVQGKEGFAPRPPKSGDAADIWIAVDATSPTVEITTARYGRGTQAGMLHILWEARDEDLSDRPITLLYGPHVDGPWRKIAGGLPNTGRYDWRVDDRVPDRVFLRIEAADRAGNTGTDTLVEPISGAGLAPQGHIHTVRPASHHQRFGPGFFDR